MSDSPRIPPKGFPSAEEDARAAAMGPRTPQTLSPSYRLAYMDPDFLQREELRPVRLQLELLKPELVQHEHGIEHTVVIFGSTRIPEAAEARRLAAAAEAAAEANPDDPELVRRAAVARRILQKSRYYDEARRLSALIARECRRKTGCDLVVITGGGPGIMEAANRGAAEEGAKTAGFNIVLPFEQQPNAYVTPELSFQFHYFAIRKMHFLLRARALVVFPGGFGTLDELFETLTLVQTGKVRQVPILLFGREFWERVVDFEGLCDEGTISPGDLDLFEYVETAEEAWARIQDFYRENGGLDPAPRC
ncbi:TIGR00730 family Rossman fold protein [Dissulfurirhabdus thermomarina]|uniref:TIGR00730 family Rossman fold protein n=1 Tax=Dissulfurirhabdus thermomarina TaxID=1765737 RepID=A0A6N9TP67_DISTH|nr:TIGR00730 family Rossman fold protein [Dissulfurirhabdus thermomarina]NDY43071.1 TIGR00730 family Rossman fold protein [Dissulfurirhabdus thermomarina]NMX22384.1 TIGR00730 family Rossman fold protein [Dissulfurirhabdus thermomarina]